jgi:hypothetical protein
LAAHVFGSSFRPIWQINGYRLLLAIYHWFSNLLSIRVRADHVPEILGGEFRAEASDENSRAYYLCVTCRFVYQWIAGWRYIRRWQFESLGSADLLLPYLRLRSSVLRASLNSQR